MHNWLLTPPVVFIIIFIVAGILSYLFSKLSFRSKKTAQEQKEAMESYACGEDTYNNRAQLDYSNFFPYAFFFTLAHVATLIITTVPAATARSFAIAAIYITGAIIGLFILLRR